MAVGIESIDRLRLDLAFGSHFDNAWTVRTDKKLLVVDDDTTKISRFSDDECEGEQALMIVNKNNKIITLVATDHKLIDNHPGGIADCAVFDDTKLEFVEFKTNAFGNSDESIIDTFDKACSQLKETLVVFNDKLKAVDVDLFNTMAVECRIVLSHRFPRASAIKQDYRLQFTNETNGIELYFERLVSFK